MRLTRTVTGASQHVLIYINMFISHDITAYARHAAATTQKETVTEIAI
jgi:hypothetical protein